MNSKLMITASLVSLGWLLMPLSYSAAVLDTWQNPDYIQKAFNEIALKNEYKATEHRILKWHQPIHYQIIYRGLKGPIPFIEAMIKAHMKQLSDITEIPITLTKHPALTNFKIILTQDAIFAKTMAEFGNKNTQQLAEETNCIGNFKHNSRYEITQAAAIIPVDHAMSFGLLPACIVEETTQVLGLPNDADWVYPSIANDLSKVDYLTGLDYLFLKLLYNPELVAGMSFKQSQPVLKAQIQKMLVDHTIQNAYRLVKKGGLYQFDN